MSTAAGGSDASARLAGVLGGAAIAAASALVFVLTISFGSPPQALGLDSSWMEVLAWGFLHHVQWGRDLVFTYGPLGFLMPGSHYYSGIFSWFVAGQIVLAAALACSVGAMLSDRRWTYLVWFATVFVFCAPRLNGDVGWALTMLFATTALIDASGDNGWKFALAAAATGVVGAMVALAKFSLFPLCCICACALAAVGYFRRGLRQAVVILLGFVTALMAVWIASGQSLLNLPVFLLHSAEVAYGYNHAMGYRAEFLAELAAQGILWSFVAASVTAAWQARRRLDLVAAILLFPLAALLFWLAFFTRGDTYHWPPYFIALAFLPLALMRVRDAITHRRVVAALFAISLASTGCVCIVSWILGGLPNQIGPRLAANLHTLAGLGALREQREANWQQLVQSAELPKIRKRVGTARVDMVTWEQGVVLMNGLNYAPRPVFQSYSVYTPSLARLNEAYFLANDAPEYVVFRLDYADGRLPMSEDGLALIALLRRYRPVLVEKGFVLLQRDASATAAAVNSAGAPESTGHLGENVTVASTNASSIAFLDVRLSAFGRLYTMLFREPRLDIVLVTSGSAKQELRYRLTRLSAASGFLIDPVVLSTQDWIRRYFAQSLPRLSALRIEAQNEWEQMLFDPGYKIAVEPADLLHSDAAHDTAEIMHGLYPGFSVAPNNPASLRIIEEDGREAVYLHAPASLFFNPEPGNYAIHAVFGVQAAAWKDANCVKGNANGVGVSLVRTRNRSDTILWHTDIDPFHAEADRGPHNTSLDGVDVAAGDVIEYRVDPGPDKGNVSCDWTYVRDVVFRRRGPVGTPGHPDRVFAENFD